MTPTTQIALGMVHRLIEAAATEGGVGPLCTIARDELLAYIGDLESERDEAASDPLGGGPFQIVPRGFAGTRFDVVRLGPVGTGTDQPRTIIAEGVPCAVAQTVAGALNAFARTGSLGSS